MILVYDKVSRRDIYTVTNKKRFIVQNIWKSEQKINSLKIRSLYFISDDFNFAAYIITLNGSYATNFLFVKVREVREAIKRFGKTSAIFSGNTYVNLKKKNHNQL